MDAGPLPLCALPVSSLYVCKVSCSLFPFKDLILLFVSEQHTRLDFDLSEAFLKDIPTAVHRHVPWLRLHRSSTSLSHHYFSLSLVPSMCLHTGLLSFPYLLEVAGLGQYDIDWTQAGQKWIKVKTITHFLVEAYVPAHPLGLQRLLCRSTGRGWWSSWVLGGLGRSLEVRQEGWESAGRGFPGVQPGSSSLTHFGTSAFTRMDFSRSVREWLCTSVGIFRRKTGKERTVWKRK